MGGQTSIENKNLNLNFQNEVDTIIKILNNSAKSNKLSLNNELRLGQTFSNISQNQLPSSTFFKHMEWNLSDIKNHEQPNWSAHVPAIIKNIQEFMENYKLEEEKKEVLKKIKEVERKLQIVNKKITTLSIPAES